MTMTVDDATLREAIKGFEDALRDCHAELVAVRTRLEAERDDALARCVQLETALKDCNAKWEAVVQQDAKELMRQIYRVHQLEQENTAIALLEKAMSACVCRTRACGHTASHHFLGFCDVCQQNCWS